MYCIDKAMIQGGKYTDLTNKCSELILRISQNHI